MEAAGLDLPGQGLRGLDDLAAAAVAQGQGHDHLGAVGGGGDGLGQFALHRFRELLQVADGIKGDLIVLHLGEFPLQVAAQNGHQDPDFQGGALPVLFGEGEQGEIRDAQFPGQAGDDPDGLHPDHMALDAQQAAALGPAAVAVHDDGHMTGKSVTARRMRIISQESTPDLQKAMISFSFSAAWASAFLIKSSVIF